MTISSYRKLFLSFILSFTFFSCSNERTVKEYYENGSLKYEFQTLNNKLHGFAKYYYPSGKLKGESYYEHDKITGKSRKYFENGKVYVSSNYLNGELHGWENTYNRNESLTSKVNWVHGKPVYTISFNEKGDTLSYSADTRKTITYSGPGKIFEIICWQDSIDFKRIRLNHDGSIAKYNGPLTCLTKRDSTLLFAQNPNWISETQAIDKK